MGPFNFKLKNTPSYSSEKSAYFDARSTHSTEEKNKENETEHPQVDEKHSPHHDRRSVDSHTSGTATYVDNHPHDQPIHPEATKAAASATAAPAKPAPPILKLTDPQQAQQEVVDTPTAMSPMGQPTPTGPLSIREERHQRAATAESTLSDKAKQKFVAAEGKEAKRMSKMLENEQKEADKSFKTALKELAKLQKVHKGAVRAESKANSKHAKAVKTEYKTKMVLIQARTAHERASSNLQSRTEGLAAEREQVNKQYTLLNRKTQEVEEIRSKKAVEDRERGAKLEALKTNPTGV